MFVLAHYGYGNHKVDKRLRFLGVKIPFLEVSVIRLLKRVERFQLRLETFSVPMVVLKLQSLLKPKVSGVLISIRRGCNF
jgi:hypothetical protein